MSAPKADSVANSGLVIVDKPTGMTSHDVVGQLRRIFNTRKIGHAGTLDPMATGVLVCGVERGTKFLAHLVVSTKSYSATIRLGTSTHTDDAEGEVTAQSSPETLAALTDDAINAGVSALTGEIMQRPSQVSAIKIAGKRAHERVRDGEQVDIPARPVTVMRFDVLAVRRYPHAVDVDVEVDCSSGTYIRALARDLGENLAVGGHLTRLRRQAVGPFTSADARTISELADAPQLSLSLDQALVRSFPTLSVTEREAADLSMGKWLKPRGMRGVYAAVDPHGRAVALVKEKGNRLATVFVARPSTL